LAGRIARKGCCADCSTGHTTLKGAKLSAAMIFFEVEAKARLDNLCASALTVYEVSNRI
jgi:hypothetical protein